MSVRLLVRQRSEEGGADKATEVILDDEVITIGRDKGCQLVLSQQAVSRNHARISRDGSLFFLEDLGSAYGTRINGQSLPKGEKRLLRNGDVIAIAQFDLTFDRVADQPKGQDLGSTAMVARHVVKDVLKGLSTAKENPYFRVMNGPKEGQRIEIQDAQEIIVGRDETCDVVLKDDLVSRRHCKIRRDWSGTHVEDLNSRNGIKVNKKRTSRRTLKDRDELEIGGIRLLYLDPSEVREAPVVLPEDDEVAATTQEPAPSEEEKAAMRRAAEQAQEEEAAEESPSEEGKETAAEEGEEAQPPAEEAPAQDASQQKTGGGEQGGEAADAPADGAAEDEKANVMAVAKQNLIPLAAMGIFALLALVLVIAVLAGV